MIQSIAAGFMITLAATLFLVVGETFGAFMFSLGLLTILYFKFHLFTGKAGLLIDGDITPRQLVKIWFGNLCGCGICTVLLIASGLWVSIVEAASAIILVRITNSWIENIALGIICGLLMNIAVQQYPTAPYVTIMSVMGFILLGANHCIADMAYMLIAATPETILPMIAALLCTTAGNVIGCNLIPYSQKQSASSSS